MRAERTGTPGVPGNGRVYAIHFTADDGKGGTCSGIVNVCVPHDQGHPICVDDGQGYGSMDACLGDKNTQNGGSRSADALDPDAISLRAAPITGSVAVIRFGLPADTRVNVSVYDLVGRHVATIEDAVLAKGTYSRSWDMTGVAKGLYFVRLHAGAATLTQRVLNTR